VTSLAFSPGVGRTVGQSDGRMPVGGLHEYYRYIFLTVLLIDTIAGQFGA